MKSFTVAMITGRKQGEWEWLRDSFLREIDRWGLVACPDVIVVDANRTLEHPLVVAPAAMGKQQIYTCPKPNIWQGRHRVTKADWWANSNARNTAICLCKTDWICFFDDRCVLMPGYLDALEAAMDGGYAMAGAYEKRTGMTVENGAIRHGGIITGVDTREAHVLKHKIETPFPCPGSWLFGANFACPLEWLLKVNGVPELADGLGMEDCLTGLLLQNNELPIKYDRRAKVVQDRTVDLIGPTYLKRDKGVSPKDKSHALLDKFTPKESVLALHNPQFWFDARKVRTSLLKGEAWPKPPKVKYVDWHDGEDISSFS